MRKLYTVLICLMACAGALAQETTKESERLHSAAEIVNEIMGTPEKAIPQDLLDKAVCVGVIPGEKKFALGVGGSFGRGALVCRRDGVGASASN
jgi:SH3 domain-containing YSC84-like protein 1